MSTQLEHSTTDDLPFCRWRVTIHDSGRDITSPEFATYLEMREWEDDWYHRNNIA